MTELLKIENLKVHFISNSGMFAKNKTIYAVDGVSFSVYQGETLGIVGESGCGKSSLARSLVGLNKITSGKATFLGKYNLATANAKLWHQLHQNIQFIFQDPIAALNPRMTILEIIAEPLYEYYPKLNKKIIFEKVLHMMKLVGLNEDQINRYPTEFSGGQCQRIAIARALILEPQLVICDESVSALDVSIKSQIINLLKDLQEKLKLTIIFISHDLSIVSYICDRVLVMYLGNIMEIGAKDTIYTKQYHPYTKALLDAVLQPDPVIEKQKARLLLDGEIPSSLNPPAGCVFSGRCPIMTNECLKARPVLRQIKEDAKVACIKV